MSGEWVERDRGQTGHAHALARKRQLSARAHKRAARESAWGDGGQKSPPAAKEGMRQRGSARGDAPEGKCQRRCARGEVPEGKCPPAERSIGVTGLPTWESCCSCSSAAASAALAVRRRFLKLGLLCSLTIEELVAFGEDCPDVSSAALRGSR